MNTSLVSVLFLSCLCVTMAYKFKRNDNCADKYPQGKCNDFQKQDMCHTLEARQNCGTTCESCGAACRDWHPKCSNKGVMEELCVNDADAFMICAKSCGLCIDH